MAEQTTDTTGAGPEPDTAPRPQLSIRGQYVKDLSFENPRAPLSLQENRAPKIELAISVNGRPLGGNDHEVELNLTAKATEGEQVAFIAELCYGGIFHLEGFTPEQMRPLLMIECPRLLFPFARRILADCTRDGGYPPLMLDPIDFVALYQQSVAKQGNGNGNGQAKPEPKPEPDSA